uniref:Uncharacterized protein n=1 Tax=Rhipicephalus appendiculatus TaxID=34631 RepID=A0A131Y9N4_RHIAP
MIHDCCLLRVCILVMKHKTRNFAQPRFDQHQTRTASVPADKSHGYGQPIGKNCRQLFFRDNMPAAGTIGAAYLFICYFLQQIITLVNEQNCLGVQIVPIQRTLCT